MLCFVFDLVGTCDLVLSHEGSLRAFEIRSSPAVGMPGVQTPRAARAERNVSPLPVPDEATRWPARRDEAHRRWGPASGAADCDSARADAFDCSDRHCY